MPLKVLDNKIVNRVKRYYISNPPVTNLAEELIRTLLYKAQVLCGIDQGLKTLGNCASRLALMTLKETS